MGWHTALQAIAFLLVAGSFIPLLNIDHWLVRAFDFPRLQITTLLAVCAFIEVIVWVASGDFPWLLLLIFGAITYQLFWILPYSPLVRQEVGTARIQDNDFCLTLLSTNVLMTNRDSAKLLALIAEHQPDIIVTLETNAWWQQQLAPLQSDYPYTVFCPLENLYGMHVYAKMALHNAEIEFLVEDDKPSIHAAIELPDGHFARLHFMHPAPPSPTENEASTERDVELLLLAENLKNDDTPTIVAGDLNDVAWSRTTKTFRKISGLLDPRIGRGTFNTFHTRYWFLRWPLDHLFHSHHFTLAKLKRLSDIGSDHFPLLSTLKYNPSAHQQPLEQKDADDEQWAQEKIAQEHADKGEVPDPTS